MQKLICGILLLMLVACGSIGKQFSGIEQPEDNSSIICIYRPKEFYQRSINRVVLIDGHKSGVLKNGSFLILKVPPGEHNIRVRNSFTIGLGIGKVLESAGATVGVDEDIVTVPGQIHYVSYTIENTGFQDYKSVIRQVSKSDALWQLRELRESE